MVGLLEDGPYWGRWKKWCCHECSEKRVREISSANLFFHWYTMKALRTERNKLSIKKGEK